MPAHFTGIFGNGQCNDGPSLYEDVVISGFSGRLPESSNMEEFKQNLFNGVDMVNDEPRRWPKGLYDLPPRLGKIKEEDLEKFDQQFFNVHQKQAECMDPQARILLEITYEAIIDAGVNPQDIRGSNTGVYIGVCTSETEQYWHSDPDLVNGYGLTGCARSMLANRISYTFDFKGPSLCIDTACSSSLFALHHAFTDIKAGKCDMAIVGGVNLILNPTMTLHFKKLNMLSDDGVCRPFDASSSGYVRSDGCVTIFLQKSNEARRIYATILNVQTNTDGYKEQGITYPDGQMQDRLMRQTYETISLNPLEVSYVEAHGTGTKVGDPEEVDSIAGYFCKDRLKPLLIGSVKSNMGHSEPASGMCSIAKVLLAMEEGIIPANLHYESPNPEIDALVNGKLKVVDKNTPWNGGLVGLNCFGFGGANAHVILKSNCKLKPTKREKSRARLVILSGRTDNAVQQLLEDVEEYKDDEEYCSLINGIYLSNIPNHYYRGYTVLRDQILPQREVIECFDTKRPIWFIYSGMGSQWGGMAKDLMHLEVFNKSIQRCADALRPEGINLFDILTQSDDACFDNILNSFVAIAAMQVALTDLLTSINIVPDGIIGHSVGEVACAYGDGCFSPEQTVLAAYWRGKSVLDTDLPKGLMAAVGLSLKECIRILPEGVFAACHNSSDSVTISGPTDEVKKTVEKLKSSGIFVKVVNISGYAFHSEYIAKAAPKLLTSLEKVIPHPKNRTSRWISTSIQENAWNTPIAQQSSAAYHVNNLLSPVLFEEALKHVPKNSICIEVAPHGLLQAILKRALGGAVTSLSLVKRNHDKNFEFLLTNVGKLYAAGAQPNVTKLFGPVKFPVGRGTPMLNSKVGWDHTQRWLAPKLGYENSSGERICKIDLSNEAGAYLLGSNVDGQNLFPAFGYIALAWEAYAKTQAVDMLKTPIIFENIEFHRRTILTKDNAVKFGINFLDGTGNFEICESGSLVVSGQIHIPEQVEKEELQLIPIETEKPQFFLQKKEIYKELRLRGYDYNDMFCGISQIDYPVYRGKLKWEENWTTFMDTMFQFYILSKDVRELFLPINIEKVIINPIKQAKMISQVYNADEVLPVDLYKDFNVLKCGGIEIRGLKVAAALRRQNVQTSPTLERFAFVPQQNQNDLAEDAEKAKMDALDVAMQLVVENAWFGLKLKVVEIYNDTNSLMAQHILEIIDGEPNLTAEVIVASADNTEKLRSQFANDNLNFVAKNILNGPVEQNCHMVLLKDLLSKPNIEEITKNILGTLHEGGFILCDEFRAIYDQCDYQIFQRFNLTVVYEQTYGERILLLKRLRVNVEKRKKTVIHLTEENFKWLDQMKEKLATAEKNDQFIYFVCHGEELFGAVGLMNCIKHETSGKKARMYFIQNNFVEKFSFHSKFYQEQLQKDLICNVLKSDNWTSFRHMKLDKLGDTRIQVEDAYVSATIKGDLSSLKWIQGSSNYPKNSHYNTRELCSVYYAAINFRDVLLSLGKLSHDTLSFELGQLGSILGAEFSGRDSSGKRIMAVVSGKALATKCIASKNMMWEIPENWTMEEASTVPGAYMTAFYALVVRGNIKEGEKILIHAGAGGVGQAAIHIALNSRLTVFTTVGSPEKKAFLNKTFPQLTDHHIGNSRDISFEQLIIRETYGKGVDLVLNSLENEMLQASIRCLAVNGRFLEIGKLKHCNYSTVAMSISLKNASFHGILLDNIIDGDEAMLAKVVKLVKEGIQNGTVRPMPTTIFNEHEVEEAFRYMASGKHIGKIVIKIRDEEPAEILCPSKKLITAVPFTYFHPEKTYIIVGGLGGFGLELANWMVSRGATKLFFASRSSVRTGYQMLMIQRWKSRGVYVAIDTNDTTTLPGCRNLIQAANKTGPVGGIFNLAVVLRDAMLEDLTEQDFKSVLSPKVDATKNLDQISRKICPKLDHFVCFSSVTSGRGNIGQTNYGLANSAMERICENRKTSGLPGLAIQWGAVGDTGIVIENFGDNNTVIAGTLPQRMSSCLHTIDLFLQQPYPVLSSMVIAEKNRTDKKLGLSLVDFIIRILGLKDMRN